MKRSANEILSEINSIDSRKRYESHWNKFLEFADLGEKEPTEQDFLQYFDHLRHNKGYAASTMWTEYSMLNKVFQ